MTTLRPSDSARRAEGSSGAPADAAGPALRVAIIGNPNTGKTTLFNALTGLRQRVGNFAGVTVERVEGQFRSPDGRRVAVLDLPGSYSLSAGAPDEQIALEVLLGRDPDRWRPDVILVVADAAHLERNLFLASQVFELGVPVVLALNQFDRAGLGVASAEQDVVGQQRLAKVLDDVVHAAAPLLDRLRVA